MTCIQCRDIISIGDLSGDDVSTLDIQCRDDDVSTLDGDDVSTLAIYLEMMYLHRSSTTRIEVASGPSGRRSRCDLYPSGRRSRD